LNKALIFRIISRFPLFLIFFLITFFTSQISAQNSSFYPSGFIGCAPYQDTLINTSSGATGYSWDFGDGASANTANPVHIFGTPGKYVVKLTAFGPVPSTKSVTITIFDKPNVAFTTVGPHLGCKGLLVAFKDSSVNPNSAAIQKYEWTFGDGGFSTLQNPTYTYTSAQAGVVKYTVALTITDANGCKNTASVPQFVATSDQPTASFSMNPSPAVACAPPLKVVFTNNSVGALTYAWDYGQGSKSSAKDSTINYLTNGNFNVVLKATDQYKCTGTYSLPVSINKPKANFSVVGIKDTVCKIMTFNNLSSGGAPTWDYGDGTTGTSLKHTYAKGGVYSVKLHTSAGACFHDTTRQIVVEEPIADFTSSPHYSCQAPFTVSFSDKSSNAYRWRWKFGNQKISFVQNPKNVYIQDTLTYGKNKRNIFTDSLFIISRHGCRDSVRKANNDTLYQPNALFKVNKAQGCVPLNIVFRDSSTSNEKITDYTWVFGDGTRMSGTSRQVNHTYNTAGTFRTFLIITNSMGCKDTSYGIYISPSNPPQPDFGFSTSSVCMKTPVVFTDLTPASNNIDSWHYTADGNMLSHCTNDKSPNWSFDSEFIGPSTVSLTVGSKGCFASVSKTITVKGPWVRAAATMQCTKPFEYSFTSKIQDATSWTWDFGDGSPIDVTNNASPEHTYAQTGDYTVTLTGINNATGCNPYVDKIVVHVRKIKAVIDAPNAFCSAKQTFFDASQSTDVFTSCLNGYRWDFGDTTRPFLTSNSIKEHKFLFKGSKIVRLIVTDINGCSDTAYKKALVNSVTAKFTLTTKPICLPSQVLLKSQSTGDTTLVKYLWTIESIGLVKGPNPSVTFNTLPVGNTTKKFKIQLIVIDTLGCMDSISKFLQPSIPDSTFNTTKNIFCTSDPNVKLTANETGAKSKFLWHFGDGRDTTVSSSYHLYKTAGSYPVKLIVTDSIGCRDSSSKTLLVRNHPIAFFVTDKDKLPTLCYPLPITFTDSSKYASTRTWNLGTGSPITPTPTVGITYSQRGIYKATLTVDNDGGCADSYSRQLNVVGPAASLSITKDHICLGEGAEYIVNPSDTNDVRSYEFDFGAGSTIRGNAPLPSKISYLYTSKPFTGNTVAQLIVYSGAKQTGCAYTYSQKIYIDQTIADFRRNDEIDTTVCVGTPIAITNNSVDADTWAWDLGDGTKSISKEVGPLHTYTVAKTYDVTLAVRNTSKVSQCSSSVTKKIRVDPLPNAKVTGNGVICPADPLRQQLQLNASGGNKYVWSPAAGLSSVNISNPIAKPSVTTLYAVLVTDSNKCQISVNVNAVVLQKAPEVHLDTTIVIGETVAINLDLGKGFKYNWNPTLALTCSTCPTPTAQPLSDQLYTLERADTSKCYSTLSTYNIVVKPLTSIDLPSAFTPNGDLHNDKIYLRGWGIKSVVEFKIYNRWGQLVFQTTDINTGWDGYYNGELQNTETYVYHATVETWIKGINLSKKGTIELLR
jgi:gliding motility-associated-like protein